MKRIRFPGSNVPQLLYHSFFPQSSFLMINYPWRSRLKRNYTLPLANINGLYSVFFMPVFAYTTVYLLHLGLTNSKIGLLLALANLIAVIAQPLVASIADRRVHTHKTLILIHIFTICLQIRINHLKHKTSVNTGPSKPISVYTILPK